VEYCANCVDLNCWQDATYGSDEDFTCYSQCYFNKCPNNLGEASDLCNCDGHGFCVMGCPANCDEMDPDEQECHIDCLAKYKDVVLCSRYCKKCVTDLGCWNDAAAYGDAEDFVCYNECRKGFCKV
jgi:hypothetical protein